LRHITVKLLAYENTRRSTMRQDVGETREVSRLELWRRASRRGDLEAWAAFQQSLEETVLTWFHAHPSCEAASRVQSESHFVARAFEQLWHLVVQGQVAGETLSEALVSLRASLNGAILETLRASRRPGAASSSWLDGEECPDRNGAMSTRWLVCGVAS
jgi:proteasome lid subunit RPN8/RPN11